MHSETLKATDEYSAARATGPRISLEDMEAKIVREMYFNAGEMELATYGSASSHNPLDVLTICILVMQNGFTVLGKSAPAAPENFDVEKGRRFAYEDAIKQLWPLEGYSLREKLSLA
jgi:Phage protein (N4 Gp49/phage Sf6 gene 66) family